MSRIFSAPLLTLLPCLIFFAGCEKTEVKQQRTDVIIDRVSEAEYQGVREFVGRLQAIEDIKVQAKVSGYLREHSFIEGSEVKKGDLLFIIDPDQYEAELSGAKAKIAQSKANLDITAMNYKRGIKLIKTNAISQLDMDKLTADKLEAEASMKSAEANLTNAELNLEYTRITAPIDGRIGERAYSIGDLVGPDAGALTTLVSIDPIYATFQVNEKLFYNTRQEQQLRLSEGKGKRTFAVKIRLSGGDMYPLQGELDFVSNRVDSDTGTLTIRADMPNPDGLLRPGQYVKVLVESVQTETMLTVPKAAILSDPQGDFVFRVDEKGSVSKHKVQLLASDKQSQFIDNDQLKVGDQIIVAGLQRVRNGQIVSVREKQKKKSSDKTPSTEK